MPTEPDLTAVEKRVDRGEQQVGGRDIEGGRDEARDGVREVDDQGAPPQRCGRRDETEQQARNQFAPTGATSAQRLLEDERESQSSR